MGTFLRSSLFSKGGGDWNALSRVHFIAVLRVVLLLEAIDIILHHHLVLHLGSLLQVLILVVLLPPLELRSRTVRSHLLLLHHLNRRVMYASQG